MKRFLAIILILALTISFTGCAKQASASSPSQGNEDDQVIIGFNCNNLTNETMTFMINVFKE